MKIGYACLQKGVYDSGYKSCNMKNASRENLLEIIKYNIGQLSKMLDYNIRNKISLFRLSSDIIPFGSSIASNIDWEYIFRDDFQELKEKILVNKLRVSVHPGQYTILNSKDKEIVEKAVQDLDYHLRLLKALGTDRTSKIVLHIGGVYDNKKQSMDRFIENFSMLGDELKARIVLENDHRSYNIEDVLYIGNKLSVAVVFDNLHHEINPASTGKSPREYILEAGRTWSEKDGSQKIHYSQNHKLKSRGSHSETIDLFKFQEFYERNLYDLEDIDLMLEVKDKNLSVIKLNNFLFNRNIKYLEEEWSRYKYSVLEHSPKIYMDIRELLKDKKEYPILEFYGLLDQALDQETTIGKGINALDHVWGYFKDRAGEDEVKKYNSYIRRFKNASISIRPVKNYLLKLALKYNEKYLINSYFFCI